MHIKTEVMKLMAMLQKRDCETYFHSTRVAQLVQRFGTELGVSAEKIYLLTIAALVHDIGKIKVATFSTCDTYDWDTDTHLLFNCNFAIATTLALIIASAALDQAALAAIFNVKNA